jgi:hypothetical protein
MEAWFFGDATLNRLMASTPMPGVAAVTGYLYDADGTRVSKGSITGWSCNPATSGFTATNDYILGPGGEQVTEVGVGGAASSNSTDGTNTTGLTWQHTNVWAGGKLLATYDNDGLHFYLDDPLPGSPATGLRRWGGLGTRRAQTDYAGVLEQTCSSLPFGDALACSGGNLQAPPNTTSPAKNGIPNRAMTTSGQGTTQVQWGVSYRPTGARKKSLYRTQSWTIRRA